MTGHIDVLVQQGRLDEAERLADSSAPGEVGFAVFRALSQIERGRLLMAQGRPGKALEAFTAAGDAAARAGIAQSGHGSVACRRGHGAGRSRRHGSGPGGWPTRTSAWPGPSAHPAPSA